jgi:hypothetical protein
MLRTFRNFHNSLRAFIASEEEYMREDGKNAEYTLEKEIRDEVNHD